MRQSEIDSIIENAKKMSKKYTENELYEMLGESVFKKLQQDGKDSKTTEQDDLLQQTLMFWDLQLQFFQVNIYGLFRIMSVLKRSKLYVENKYSKKMERILTKMLKERLKSTEISEEDKQCVATHLALQLAGIEE